MMNVVTLMYVILKVLTASPSTSSSTISKIIPAHESTWTYDGSDNGVEHWGIKYPKCNGHHQSPIDISTKEVKYNESLSLELIGFSKLYQAFIENNGHTVQLGIQDSIKPSLTGSAVDNKHYNFAQLHFHWGKGSEVGSEHSINGFFYPLEMHMVFYKDEYGSFDSALAYDDGIVVLGVFFKHSKQENHALDLLINEIKTIPRYQDKSKFIHKFDLSLLLPKNVKKFYKYSGSLTTPPCTENVTWIVLNDAGNIAEDQTEVFRQERTGLISSLTGEYGYLNHNYRDQAFLNKRIVQASFKV